MKIDVYSTDRRTVRIEKVTEARANASSPLGESMGKLIRVAAVRISNALGYGAEEQRTMETDPMVVSINVGSQNLSMTVEEWAIVKRLAEHALNEHENAFR